MLLNALSAEARRCGARHVEVDVTDKYTAARALYERYGYVAYRTVRLGWMRRVFGFERVQAMRLPLDRG